MAEGSYPWPGTTVGDSGPYTDDDWDNIWETLYGSGVAPYNNRGVIRNWLNELAVTSPGVNAVDVATGAALVHGKFYRNTAVVNVVGIPNSVGAWREDLICLQSSWVAQTIRVYRHANPADGVPYPAPTQTDGACWEIPLYAVRINAAGTITLITDLRDYVSDLMQPKHAFFDAVYSDTGQYIQTQHAGWELTGTGQNAYIEMQVPIDFKEIVGVYVLLIGDTTTNQALNCMTRGALCGQIYSTSTDSVGPITVAFTLNYIECFDVTQAFDGASLQPGMVVGVRVYASAPFNHTHLVILGLDFRYR